MALMIPCIWNFLDLSKHLIQMQYDIVKLKNKLKLILFTVNVYPIVKPNEGNSFF